MDGVSRFAREFMKGRQLDELGQLDIDTLKKWSDAELAGWQSGHSADSPQWLLAEQQWRLRLLDRQAEVAARQANKAALIGVGGTLAGALLGGALAWILGK